MSIKTPITIQDKTCASGQRTILVDAKAAAHSEQPGEKTIYDAICDALGPIYDYMTFATTTRADAIMNVIRPYLRAPEREIVIDEEEYVRMLSKSPADVKGYGEDYRSLKRRGYDIRRRGTDNEA